MSRFNELGSGANGTGLTKGTRPKYVLARFDFVRSIGSLIISSTESRRRGGVGKENYIV